MANDVLEVRSTSGLSHAGGVITEEWLRKLRDSRSANRVWREMSDNDPIVGAFIYAIKSLIRQVSWTVNPGGDSDEHESAAEFVRQCMADMSMTWQDFLSEILTMVSYGWSYFEIIYKIRGGIDAKKSTHRSRYDDGALGWRKFQLVGQDTLDRWTIDPDGGIRGMWQQDPSTGTTEFLPIEKAVLFRTETTKNNPEGRSMLRNAYRSWFFLKRIQEFEAIGVERDLAGYPVLEVPPQVMNKNADGPTKALRADLEEMVQQIKRDEREGIVIPAEKINGKETGYRLRLMSTGGRRPMDVDAIVKRYESRIAMSVLSEFLLLGTDKVGSFALADTKTDLFAVALGAMLDNIAQTVNRFAVTDLMRLNGISTELWPEIVHGDIEKPDITQFANYLKTLSDAGFDVLDAETERVAREYGGLPMPEATTEVATPEDNVTDIASARDRTVAGGDDES